MLQEGLPAIFVHGGPGGGTSGKERRFFDPAVYRIVLFDQRGCGKSTPYADLTDNTTWTAVSDMESIREHLGIEKWQVFGGSWGSTLSITYAIKHAERVTALVLRGIFLLRRSELEWFYQEGASHIYPDAWETYLNHIPEAERGDLMAAYHKRLFSDDAEVRIAVSAFASECSWRFCEQLRSFPPACSRRPCDVAAVVVAGRPAQFFVRRLRSIGRSLV
jgi:proline iminopeptidase